MLIKNWFKTHLVASTNKIPARLSITPHRLVHRLKKDIGYIKALSVTPDGSLLALASNGLIVVFDVFEGKEIMRHEVTAGWTTSVSLCRTGKFLAVGTSEGVLMIYDLNAHKVIRSHTLPFEVKSVHIREDGSMVAGASQNIACVYSMKTGKLIRDFVLDSFITFVFISPSYHHLCVHTSSSAQLLEINTGKTIGTFNDGRGITIHNLGVSSKYCLMNVVRNSVLLWDVWTEELLRFYRHPGLINGAYLDPFGKWIATACDDGKVRIFSTENDEEGLRVFAHPDRTFSVALSENSKFVFTGCEKIRVWDMKTGENIKEFKGYFSPVITACLNQDGRQLLVGGYHGDIKMYDLYTGRQVRRFKGHSSWISSIALNENQQIVATSSHDGTAKVFYLSGQLIHTLRGHQDCVHSVAISPKDSIIATGARDQKIMLWNMKTGNCIRSWIAHAGYIRSVIFDSSGTRLLSAGSDGIARLWDLSENRCIKEYGFHCSDIYSAVFSPDEQFLVTASEDGTFKLFTIEGELKNIFVGHRAGVREVFFHIDGTLISGSLDNTAKRWDPHTGKCLKTYTGMHSDWIRCVCVRPKDSMLILGSKDGTLSFSDLESGKHLATLINLDKGFLWTTPPDDSAKSGWIWTDRLDLVETMEIEPDGKFRLIDQESDYRNNYLSTHNSMSQVMSKLRNKDCENKHFEHLVKLCTNIQSNQMTIKLLQDSKG